MAYDAFAKQLVVYCDTRERENKHVLDGFAALGVKTETRKLDLGDYSFAVGDTDFRLSCVIERKANPDELYGNIMDKADTTGTNRLMHELAAASRQVNQLIVLIETVGSEQELRGFIVPDYAMKMSPQRKVSAIGKPCHDALIAWSAMNRYGFSVLYVKDPANTAQEMVKRFYAYWRNYKNDIAPRR